MKQLVLVVHANIQQELADQLRAMDQVQGFTLSKTEGHGSQTETDPFLSARDRVVGYVPRVRVDILLEDGQVDSVLAALRSGTNSMVEQGIYWITTVDEQGRL